MVPERFSNTAYAVFRTVVGFLFLCHGLQKIFGLFGGIGGHTVPLASLAGAAGLIECICGALVMFGLFTRPAAFLASGEMAFAYFLSHQPQGALPLQNRGELAALYCFTFLFISSRNSDGWSLDALLWRRSTANPKAAPRSERQPEEVAAR